MDEGKMRALLEQKARKAAKHYQCISPSFDVEIIHKFRTDVKKLRAIVELLSIGDKKEAMALPASFHHNYRLTGAIRDTQLFLEKIVAKWQKPLPELFKMLEGRLNQLKTAWECGYRANPLKKLTRHIKERDFSEIKPADFRTYFTEKLHHLEMAANADDDQIHKKRKLAKTLMYTAKLAEQEWAKGYDALEGIPVEKLEILSQSLGDYNDRRVMLATLEVFSTPSVGEVERQAIKDIAGALREAQQKAKTSLPKEVQAIISAAEGNHSQSS